MFCSRLSAAIAAVVIPTVFGGACAFDIPLAGKVCASDVDCDVGGEREHFCSVGLPRVCVPGSALTPRENEAPILQSSVIVVEAGRLAEGTFTASDPDSDDAPVFAVVGDGPANGDVDVFSDGRYRFVASEESGLLRSAFVVSVQDSSGGITTSVVTTIVIVRGADGLLTWDGSESSEFQLQENWSPAQTPSATTSIFFPQTDAFDPVLDGAGQSASLYVGPNVDLRLDGLAIFGPEIFSASGQGDGTLIVVNESTAAGTLPGLAVEGKLSIETALDIKADLVIRAGASAEIAAGAALTVRGNLIQASEAGAIGTASALEEGGSDLVIDGNAVLRGGGIGIPNGTVTLRGDFESTGKVDVSRLILRGRALQRIVVGENQRLPSTSTQIGSKVRFLRTTTVVGNLDVSGALSVAANRVVRVEGTLVLRGDFQAGDDPDGTVVARRCTIASSVLIPPWVICGADFDAGPNFEDGGPNIDDGGSDAGPDASEIDAGGLDAGDLDAGVDAGDIDAGAFDAGVDAGDIDAGIDGGIPTDAGALDAGVDAGAFDAGDVDAGAFDAGIDGGIAFDAGVDDGGVVPACSLNGRGIVSNGFAVIEAGKTRLVELNVVQRAPGGIPDFAPNLSGSFGAASMFSLVSTGSVAVTVDVTEASGFYTIPVVVDPANGRGLIDECLSIRVVGPNEGRRPTPRQAGNWNWSNGWDGERPPGAGETVFIPAGVLTGAEVHVVSQVDNLLVETGAGVTLRWNLDSPAAVEIAVGTGNAFDNGQKLLPDTDLLLGSGVRLKEIDGTNAGNTLTLSGMASAEKVKVNGGTLDPNGWTLFVDDTVELSSLTAPAFATSNPSSRIVAPTFSVVQDLAGPFPTTGEFVVLDTITIESSTEEPTAFGGDHTIVLADTNGAPVTISTALDLAIVRLEGADVSLSLAGEPTITFMDFGTGRLCVDDSVVTPINGDTISIGSLSQYAHGPAWNHSECDGPLTACGVFTLGTILSSCPF